MNTTAAAAKVGDTVAFDRAYAESRFFARNIDAIKAQVSHNDYVWDAPGKAIAEKSIRQAMQAQMVPATAANVAAALEFVGEGKEGPMNTTTTRIYRSTTSAAAAMVGDIVSYEDMNNPAAFYTVIGHVKDTWGTEARIVSHSTGEVSTSTLRGAGWVMAVPA